MVRCLLLVRTVVGIKRWLGFAAAMTLAVAGCSSEVRAVVSAFERGVTSTGKAPPVLGRTTVSPESVAASSDARRREATPVRVLNASFVGSQGWVLGSVACASGRCAALAHSSNGGRTWSRLPAPPVHVANLYSQTYSTCSDPCVSQIKIVNSRVGYLFDGITLTVSGRRALFMTVDGGHTWRREPGGADAIVANGTRVLRVFDTDNCPPHCAYRAEIGTVGQSGWRDLALPRSTVDAQAVILLDHRGEIVMGQLGFPASGNQHPEESGL